MILYTPYPHYGGRDVCVFDYVESMGLSIFEVNRFIENAGVFGHKVCYGWENNSFKKIDNSRELHGYIQRIAGSIRKIFLYLEDSFHEILVHQLGYDPYEVDENEEGAANGKDRTANHDHEGGGIDIDAHGNNNNNYSDSGSESFFSAIDSDYNQSEDDDADFNDNIDKNTEWFGIEHYKEFCKLIRQI